MIGPRSRITRNIGKLDDFIAVPYQDGISTVIAYLHTGYFHVHGASFVYPDKAAPVQLTSAAGAWLTTGNKIEVIPASTILHSFDLHWCSVWDISTSLYGIIDIFAGGVGAEVQIGAVDIGRTANFSRESAMPVQIPQQPANTRISCRLTTDNAGAQTCRVKFYGHVYATSLT